MPSLKLSPEARKNEAKIYDHCTVLDVREFALKDTVLMASCLANSMFIEGWGGENSPKAITGACIFAALRAIGDKNDGLEAEVVQVAGASERGLRDAYVLLWEKREELGAGSWYATYMKKLPAPILPSEDDLPSYMDSCAGNGEARLPTPILPSEEAPLPPYAEDCAGDGKA